MESKFWNKFTEKMSGAADTAGGYAQRIGETAKLRYEISRATKRANAAYEKLGRGYYEHMKLSQDNGGDIFDYGAYEKSICAEIEAASAEIALLDSRLREAEQLNVCPNCGSTVGIKSEKCRRCGCTVKR